MNGPLSVTHKVANCKPNISQNFSSIYTERGDAGRCGATEKQRQKLEFRSFHRRMNCTYSRTIRFMRSCHCYCCILFTECFFPCPPPPPSLFRQKFYTKIGICTAFTTVYYYYLSVPTTDTISLLNPTHQHQHTQIPYQEWNAFTCGITLTTYRSGAHTFRRCVMRSMKWDRKTDVLLWMCQCVGVGFIIASVRFVDAVRRTHCQWKRKQFFVALSLGGILSIREKNLLVNSPNK